MTPPADSLTIDAAEVLAELDSMSDVPAPQLYAALARERVIVRTLARQVEPMQRELARLSNELEKARGGDHGDGPAAGS